MNVSERQDGKFNRFWELIQSQAIKKHSQFFMDCGEGREFETEDLKGEDISGWLIPLGRAAEFEKEWSSEDFNSDAWTDFVRFAEWNKEADEITIEFNEY